MATVCLAGTTGLVGAHIFSDLKTLQSVKKIYAYSRKELEADAKTSFLTSQPSSSWPETYPSGIDLFISALGTTRAQAGGFENQRKIDYDLNLALAHAAKKAGTKVYVLISSGGSSSSSMFGYTKMKGELEDAVKEIDFDHVVILRPGLLVGQRGAHDRRAAEFALRQIASFAGAVSGNRLKDFWAIDSDIVAHAAVKAGLDAVNGGLKEKVSVLQQADIVRLGRQEQRKE